jgi:hypothetical protein
LTGVGFWIDVDGNDNVIGVPSPDINSSSVICECNLNNQRPCLTKNGQKNLCNCDQKVPSNRTDLITVGLTVSIWYIEWGIFAPK